MLKSLMLKDKKFLRIILLFNFVWIHIKYIIMEVLVGKVENILVKLIFFLLFFFTSQENWWFKLVETSNTVTFHYNDGITSKK